MVKLKFPTKFRMMSVLRDQAAFERAIGSCTNSVCVAKRHKRSRMVNSFAISSTFWLLDKYGLTVAITEISTREL